MITVRRCGPLEYALRVLAEVAMLTTVLLTWRHLPWLAWSRHLPAAARLAAAAFLAAVAALDVAELRIQRKATP